MLTQKLRRFFVFSVLITIFTLFHVHQKIEIIKLGYELQAKRQVLRDTLDEQRCLIYRINAMESPLELRKRLFEESIELVQTDIENIYYASAKLKRDNVVVEQIHSNMLARLLDAVTLKAEAGVKK